MKLWRSIAVVVLCAMVLGCVVGCSRITYTVSFSGGIEPITGIKKGSTITLPTPTREGFVFLGWYYTVDKVEHRFTEDTPVDRDYSLYAIYERDFSAYSGCPSATLGEPNALSLDAVGVCWATEFFLPCNPTHSYDDWERLISLADELCMAKIRIPLNLSSFETANGGYDFSSDEFDGFLQVLDIAQELGMKVDIAFSFAEAKRDSATVSQGVTALIDYLVTQRRYNCLSDVTILGGIPQNSAESYESYFSAIDSALTAASLREGISLISAFDDTVKEFGADVISDEYARAMYYADFAVNAINDGTTSLYASAFFDMNVLSDGSTDMTSQGLLGNKSEGFAPKPLYHAYGMLVKFCRPDSLVFPMDFGTEGVSGTYLLDTNGKSTYVIVNNTSEEVLLTVKGTPKLSANLRSFLFSTDTVPSDTALPSLGADYTTYNGDIYITLPANSFAVISDVYEVDR